MKMSMRRTYLYSLKISIIQPSFA